MIFLPVNAEEGEEDVAVLVGRERMSVWIDGESGERITAVKGCNIRTSCVSTSALYFRNVIFLKIYASPFFFFVFICDQTCAKIKFSLPVIVRFERFA